MAWSGWKLLATRGYEWTDEILYDGPACYELAIGTADWNRRIVYVGETRSLRGRLIAYARGRSNIWGFIDGYLAGPAKLYYRFWPTATKCEAQIREAKLLRDYAHTYRWNSHKNEAAVLAAIERRT